MTESAHHIEPELLQSPPRSVKARNDSKRLQLVLALGLIGFEVLLAVRALFMRQAKYRGATVRAKIIKHERGDISTR
jgi:hypothetical protein